MKKSKQAHDLGLILKTLDLMKEEILDINSPELEQFLQSDNEASLIRLRSSLRCLIDAVCHTKTQKLMMDMVVDYYTPKEICTKLKISESSYYNYLVDFRREVKKLYANL